MTLRKSVLFISACLFFISVRAQFIPVKIVQFSGIVMTSDSLIGIPFAIVYNKCDKRAAQTREDGYFSFVAKTGDTLLFTALGFHAMEYVVPKEIEGDKFSAIQLLSRDNIWLDTIVVYPFPSKEDFKRAFVYSEVPRDQIDIALQNLNREQMRELGEGMAMDGGENSNYFMKKEAARFYYAGQTPPQNIFNVMSWVQFIQAWKNGDFKRKK